MTSAHDSGAHAAIAVEVHHVASSRPYLQGIFTGLALALLLWQAYLLRLGLALRELFAFGARSEGVPWERGYPEATRLVLSLPWLYGVPAIAAVALALLVWRRPRSAWPYVLLALALAATAGATWHFAELPISEIVGDR